MFPTPEFEPETSRLQAGCSTTWANEESSYLGAGNTYNFQKFIHGYINRTAQTLRCCSSASPIILSQSSDMLIYYCSCNAMICACKGNDTSSGKENCSILLVLLCPSAGGVKSLEQHCYMKYKSICPPPPSFDISLVLVFTREFSAHIVFEQWKSTHKSMPSIITMAFVA